MSPTKRRLIIVLATLLLVAMAPAVVMAAGGQFTDDDDSIFEAHIEWLADAGVTAGCNPPANDHFCPTDNVNRGQMAAFMRRFAQYIGAEDGIVSAADHAVEADHAATADSATSADNAGTVDGKNAIQFQPTTNDFETGDFTVSSDGFNQTVLTAEVTTTDGSGFFCLIGSSQTADIRVHASGAVTGLSVGEQATLKLAAGGTNIEGTYRYVSDASGSFAIEWLHELVPGGTGTYELRVEEATGDQFTVTDATLFVEVISDTRCKGTPIIVFPGEPAGDHISFDE